jgi:SAM-dependent methyltransferase
MNIPWFLKIPAKIVLSRLPIGYDVWRSLNMFRAGGMDDPETAFRVYHMHCEAAGFADRRGYTVLELGPGDSMLTALYARSAGAAQSILVDQSTLAAARMDLFNAAEQMLSRKGVPVPCGVAAAGSVTDALTLLNCRYMVDGLSSLRALPSNSVDFIFSNAVIEHVRKDDFAATAREMHRILKPDGVASHWIDYRDHLENRLNNLRFSERIWESEFMVNSGFYTNRLPWPAIRKLFEEAGFMIEIHDTKLWVGGLPTPQRVMHEPFCNTPADELMVMTNWVLLRKAG